MGRIGKNIIVGTIFLVILFLIINTNTSQMLLTILFTTFVLSFSEDIVEKYIHKEEKIKKFFSMVLSTITLTLIGLMLYYSFKYMTLDLNTLINNSQDKIIFEINKLGFFDITSVKEIYTKILSFIKDNIGMVTFGATLLIKVLLGIILGVVFHFSKIELSTQIKTLEEAVIFDIKTYIAIMFQNFKNIMSIQVIISLMNTTIITLMTTIITYLWSGDVLPYWYVIIPLTMVLSLIPVVGNVLINIILMLATIQISLGYMIVGIGMFLIIHKLKLLVIGTKMKEKMNLPFSFILVSMILGEFLFHSMSGMLLGMVIITTLLSIMRKIHYNHIDT